MEIQSPIIVPHTGWSGPDLGASVTQLYKQGWLYFGAEKRRYVFAFDGLVLCVKEVL